VFLSIHQVLPTISLESLRGGQTALMASYSTFEPPFQPKHLLDNLEPCPRLDAESRVCWTASVSLPTDREFTPAATQSNRGGSSFTKWGRPISRLAMKSPFHFLQSRLEVA
jgi:hypothetical protein